MTKLTPEDALHPDVLRAFLRGKRNYIQGTQLISRCAELFDDPSTLLFDAVFTEITEKEVIACSPEVASTWSFSTIGRVSFQVGDTTHQLALLKTQRTVERLDTDMNISYKISPSAEPFEGSATFSGITDIEGMLNVIVQTIKSLHASSEPRAEDIWFTGLRRLPLPAKWGASLANGQVTVKCIRRMNNETNVQTMLETTLDFADETRRMTGMVSFAFRLPEHA